MNNLALVDKEFKTILKFGSMKESNLLLIVQLINKYNLGLVVKLYKRI